MSVDVEGPRSPESDCIESTIEIDTALHPVSAVQRVCYALSERAVFEISRRDGLLSVLVTPRMENRLDEVLDQFRTSLIDYTLREEIEARTQGLRDLIWRTAFAEARGRSGS